MIIQLLLLYFVYLIIIKIEHLLSYFVIKLLLLKMSLNSYICPWGKSCGWFKCDKVHNTINPKAINLYWDTKNKYVDDIKKQNEFLSQQNADLTRQNIYLVQQNEELSRQNMYFLQQNTNLSHQNDNLTKKNSDFLQQNFIILEQNKHLRGRILDLIKPNQYIEHYKLF
jgi:hypothetical protein